MRTTLRQTSFGAPLHTRFCPRTYYHSKNLPLLLCLCSTEPCQIADTFCEALPTRVVFSRSGRSIPAWNAPLSPSCEAKRVKILVPSARAWEGNFRAHARQISTLRPCLWKPSPLLLQGYITSHAPKCKYRPESDLVMEIKQSRLADKASVVCLVVKMIHSGAKFSSRYKLSALSPESSCSSEITSRKLFLRLPFASSDAPVSRDNRFHLITNVLMDALRFRLD